LDDLGYDVILFDVVPSKYKRKTQKEIIGDIINYKNIKKSMAGFSFVYHFAAQLSSVVLIFTSYLLV